MDIPRIWREFNKSAILLSSVCAVLLCLGVSSTFIFVLTLLARVAFGSAKEATHPLLLSFCGAEEAADIDSLLRLG